jgi:asparagine synthase (glutamine-hydrolysing)
MCGIAGYAGDFVVGLVARMNAAQAHRGPDGTGAFEDAAAGVALGHVRLSILDLSPAAAQPMYSPDNRFVLVFNGEIYNFKELREELSARSRTFLSTGDTEVLLHGLQEHGKAFIEKLNGMFAFALWDRQEQALLLARDHLGIKPLYYAEPQPGVLLFASEIKALCAYPGLKREPDFEALQQYLTYCHAAGGRTALKGVKRLPPGHWLQWRRNCRIEIQRFWRPPFRLFREGKRKEAAAELQSLVQQAVLRQLVSDVPVGAFLSGGLDSSFVTALAAGGKAAPDFQGYTITYPAVENRLDRAEEDAPYARSLAGSLGL